MIARKQHLVIPLELLILTSWGNLVTIIDLKVSISVLIHIFIFSYVLRLIFKLQVMKESKGKANPVILNKILQEKLNAGS